MSVLRISAGRADELAARAFRDGLTWQTDEQALRDYLDVATAGDLDTVEMDLAVDLVRARLLKLTTVRGAA